jgi:proteasome lid subunit RPN8/RPN11
MVGDPAAGNPPDGSPDPSVGAEAVLRLPRSAWLAMAGHCLRAFPEEGCGLLVGPENGDRVERVVPTPNVAASARVYTVDPRSHLRAEREAEAEGLAVVGVFHSHTHTEAYPSDTDIRQAPDPGWHYVLVSLRGDIPMVRSFRIRDGGVQEEPVLVLEERPGPEGR